ncbi:N-acylneuraminate cytidylyltransferase [Salegentibacter holothuriorum]|uniref:N-acylneuraminate cytidylyltransferase n=1 Tax=Salegentibacter holothuriorum TaxID=241145 RepID=A0A1T5APC0_9FLAO|nr:hypothetical protein [Salegentibacter holothuriorum]SKB36699.1 N-acylneuraminate cytidylyltransferase [Salegentibacter holothuriorum]
MKYSIFLPVRKGSERIERKNTRDFSGIEGGLLKLKLKQLEGLPQNMEVIISTNDEECLEIAGSFFKKIRNLRIIKRADRLGAANTPLKELIKHAGEVSAADFILWTHVTSPFCQNAEYLKAIREFEKGWDNDFDSLVSGKDYKEFLMDKSSLGIVNNNTAIAWPRTQDLPEWFEINNAIFLTSRANFCKGKRMGDKPKLLAQSKIVSLDIDYLDDFKIAEAVYDKYYK